MFKTSETESTGSEGQSTSGQTSVKNSNRHMTNKSNTNCANSANSDESATNSGQSSNVKRKFRSLTFGRRKKSLQCLAKSQCKQNNCNNNQNNSNCNKSIGNNGKKKRSSAVWAFRLCARTDSCVDITQTDNTCDSCVCTAYKKTEEQELSANELSPIDGISSCETSTESSQAIDAMEKSSESDSMRASNPLSVPQTNQSNDSMASGEQSANEPYVETSFVSYGLNGMDSSVGTYQSSQYATQSMMSEVRSVQVRVSELALALRSQLALTVSPYPYLARWGEVAELTPGFLNRFCIRSDSSAALNEGQQQIHTQIDYIHCLVPDLLQITNCSFYWGKMDRYEAERLLDNKPEGTFLLRDSAQEEHLFSVSFRRFDRSLHARIEQWNHRFSFDSHDPGVYASSTVCGLIEHYKDPSHCMFFEPMLTIPLHRNFSFSLQHLSRAVINSGLTYDSIHSIQLPKRLKNYLKEYHYKQQVRVRRLDGDH